MNEAGRSGRQALAAVTQLFGSDYPASIELSQKNLWAAFRTLPLTDAELRTIAGNVPPHMQGTRRALFMAVAEPDRSSDHAARR